MKGIFTNVVNSFRLQSGHGPLQHILGDKLHFLGGDQWAGAVGAHAPGVGASVALPDPLVVLRWQHWPDCVAVCEGQYLKEI